MTAPKIVVSPIGRKPAANNFAEFADTHFPQTAPRTSTEAADSLVARLLAQPDVIAESQAAFDAADRAYQRVLAVLTVKALSERIFPGKKEGEPLRAASNDSERETAINTLIGTDREMIELALRRESALRILQRERNLFEALKLAAQLQISQGK